MAKKQRPATPTAPNEPPQRTSPSLPEWRWRTFPVFFAFFAGAMLMALLNGYPGTEIAAIAQIIALLALSYGLARIVVRKLLAERRISRREEQIARGEEPDDEYEDVVVYRNKEP